MRVHEFACVIVALGTAAAPACPGRCGEIYQPRAFFGYDCDADCSAQKAGFAWAERQGITTPTACAAIDPGFAAGCRAYAAEGLAPFDAGYAWALENEVADPVLCSGGGDGFRLGCCQYVDESPGPDGVGCAEAWPGRAKAFPATTQGQ